MKNLKIALPTLLCLLLALILAGTGLHPWDTYERPPLP
jgi:hypothetical protein